MTHQQNLKFRVLTLLALAIALFLQGCRQKDASTAKAAVEQPIAAIAAPAPKQEPAPVKLPPASAGDVQSALKRVFNDDLRASVSSGSGFMTGDFNGDGSEDLAVVAHPTAGKLGEINDELANWTIQDADKFFVVPPNKSIVTPEKVERPKIEDEDVLAIIHGYGPMGWRNPDARQAYLLKHGAASYSGKAPSISKKSIRDMRLPIKTEILIGKRNQQPGFLFWTGSAYGWHAGSR